MKTKKPTPGFWLIFIGVSFIIDLLAFAISSQFPHPFDEEITRDEFAFLPPKVFSEAGGFLDGVGWAEDVLLDTRQNFLPQIFKNHHGITKPRQFVAQLKLIRSLLMSLLLW